MIRAPSAPASLQAVDRPLHLRDGHLVVVAQARVRRVEQPAERAEVARSSAATAASTRSFSVDHVADAAVERGGSAATSSSGVAQRLDAEQPAAAGTRARRSL